MGNNNETNKLTIAFTGHRPNKLWGYNYNLNWNCLRDNIRNLVLQKFNTYNEIEVIYGTALGVDTIAAFAALDIRLNYCGKYNIKLHAAIPFMGYESKWNEQSQHTFHTLLKMCDEVTYVCKPGYSPHKLQLRNEYMVDNCDLLIAVWNGSNSGTKNCIDYAIKKNKDVIYINPNDISK